MPLPDLELIDENLTSLQRDLVCACAHTRDFAALLAATTSEDFPDPVSRVVRDVLVAMAREGLDPDVLTVRHRLVDLGEDDFMRRFLAHYTASDATNANFRDVQRWVAELRTYTLRRRIVSAGEQLIQLGQQCSSVEKLQTEVPDLVAAALGSYQRVESVPEKQALEDVGKRFLDELASPVGFRTGFHTLDNALRGFRPGEVVVMAADSSMGKSAAVLQLARGAAREVGVYFWSGEMSIEELCARSVCQSQQCTLEQIEDSPSRFFSEADVAPGVWFDCEPDTGWQQLLTRLAIHKLQHPNFRLAVIDYLGLLCENDYKEISAASRALKKFARRAGITIWIVHQLNRDVSRRAEKEPQTSDIRDSGQIVQDADKIVMFYRPGFYQDHLDQLEAWMFIRKFRNGRRNQRVQCRYYGDQFRWEPYKSLGDWSDLRSTNLDEVNMEDVPL